MMEIVWMVVIGIAAGWIAGVVMKGRGLGLTGNLVVGVVGALVGGFLFRMLGVTAGGLVGQIVIAAAGVGLHQLTGSTVPDAVGSILVGLLLGVIAVVLISRNRAFLVGEVADPRVRERLLADLLAQPEVASVSMLYVEIVGAGRLLVVGAVDLDGDAAEHEVAERLARMEGRLRADPLVVAAVLSLSGPGEPPLAPTR